MNKAVQKIYSDLKPIIMGSKVSAPECFLEIHTSPSEPPIKLNQSSANSEEFLELIKSKHNINCNSKLFVTFLTHGYMSFLKKEGEHFYDIKDAILINGGQPHIVVLVDWSAKSGVTVFDYFSAVRNARGISEWLADFVKILRSEYKENVYIHGIGFSLGAHLIANSAEFADEGDKESRLKCFNRITGLDPAGPAVVFKEGLFSLLKHQTNKLRSDHADFVDCIHTTDHLGTDECLGSCDFFPNFGNTQRGLPNLGYLNVPSHIFCLKLFLHTINPDNKERFSTNRKIVDLKMRQIEEESSPVTMGYFCDTKVLGMYHVEVDKIGKL